MAKKFYIGLGIAVLFVVSSFFYLNSYNHKFVGKLYFCKKYEKADDEYLSTAMYGDVILFEKDKIIELTVTDLDKYRKNDGVNMNLITPLSKYAIVMYEYDGIKYKYFDKEIVAVDMEDMALLSDSEIEYKGKKYILESNLENVFFQGRMQFRGIVMGKGLEK